MTEGGRPSSGDVAEPSAPDAARRPAAGRMERTVRRWMRPALWLGVAAPAVALLAELLLDELGANPVQALEQESGEWALRFLAGSLAVTPLIRWTGWGWLIPARRFLGLASFWWACAHFGVWFALDMVLDVAEMLRDVTKHPRNGVGMLALLLMAPLAVTSTKGMIRRMGGARWRALHRLVYLVAVVAMVHFLLATKLDLAEPILYGAVFAALLGVRLAGLRRGATP